MIEAAINGFENQKERIDTQIAELRAMLTGGSTSVASRGPGRPTGGAKRKFSPEALQRMREAQQRRWAKARGEAAPAANKSAKPKAKRRLSPAGRKAIIDALKKRWAAKRAAEKA
ncbi:MAG TPA: hypothetical protein VHW24_07180 [Bryobacteraceae bacterium]|nr:hypothetical protein [Bryobacteraceae bacterium]